jgi:hypothetical protein
VVLSPKPDDPIAAWCKQGKASEILGTRERYACLFADDQHWKMMPCKVSSEGGCITNSDLTSPGVLRAPLLLHMRRGTALDSTDVHGLQPLLHTTPRRRA